MHIIGKDSFVIEGLMPNIVDGKIVDYSYYWYKAISNVPGTGEYNEAKKQMVPVVLGAIWVTDFSEAHVFKSKDNALVELNDIIGVESGGYVIPVAEAHIAFSCKLPE